MSGSRTTIADKDWLDNVHPGDILSEDFLIGTEIPLNEVAAATGIGTDLLAAIIASRDDIDAAVDARLTRYFTMSSGYFLRLQNRYDVEEVADRDREALDRIIPRAA